MSALGKVVRDPAMRTVGLSSMWAAGMGAVGALRETAAAHQERSAILVELRMLARANALGAEMVERVIVWAGSNLDRLKISRERLLAGWSLDTEVLWHAPRHLELTDIELALRNLGPSKPLAPATPAVQASPPRPRHRPARAGHLPAPTSLRVAGPCWGSR